MAGVGLDNVRSPKSKTPWLNALYADVDDVIVDVPGGALDDLIGVLGRAGAIAGMAADAERKVVLVTPIGVEVDAVLWAQGAVDRFGAAVHHVVVKNGYFGVGATKWVPRNPVVRFAVASGGAGNSERTSVACSSMGRSSLQDGCRCFDPIP
ncbi:MAG: hypothetical protein WAN59_15525 [Candidatus Baltobacteraceae bacterium]